MMNATKKETSSSASFNSSNIAVIARGGMAVLGDISKDLERLKAEGKLSFLKIESSNVMLKIVPK